MKSSLVEKYRKSCKGNGYVLALRIYNDLVVMDYTEQDLIDVLSELESKGLDTYYLLTLTKKRLHCNRNGYYLVDIPEDEYLPDALISRLREEMVIDYQKLVRDCNSKSNNAKSLATALYNKWLKLGSIDKDLIGIYKAMSLATLSTYELEYLTKKRLVMTEQGYILEDCVHGTTVTIQSDTDTDHCVKNANALGILTTYKNKYNISDTMWVKELERLQDLCNSTDTYVVAEFIENNFL